MRILILVPIFALLTGLAMGCAGAPAHPDPVPPATLAAPATAVPDPPAERAQSAPSSQVGKPASDQLPPPVLKWSGGDQCEDAGNCAFRSGLGKFLTTATPAGGGAFYTAHLNGEIARYDMADGSRRVVAEGLVMPQGLVVVDGRLYATHLNNFCDAVSASTHLLNEKALKVCDFRAHGLLPGVSLEDAMDDLMARVSAAIVSWHINPDSGDLSDLRTELDGLPATGRDHSPNGLMTDDGWIYATIGHPFDDPVNHEKPSNVPYHFNLDNLQRPDTAGTILRFRPGAPLNYEIWATGLRNVYGISMAADGTIYGPDNDSHAPGAGMALEELNAFRQGEWYGYPDWGTNHAPPEAGVTEPIAILKGNGSTTTLAADDALYVAYVTSEADGFVVDRFQYQTWERSRFYRNADTHIVSLHEADDRLYVFTLSGTVSVVDKTHAGPVSAPIKR